MKQLRLLFPIYVMLMFSCSKDNNPEPENAALDNVLKVYEVSQSMVKTGETITITGENFDNPEVTLNGLSVKLLDATSYQLVVEIPRAGRSGALIVKQDSVEVRSPEIKVYYHLLSELIEDGQTEFDGRAPNNRSSGMQFRSTVKGTIIEIGAVFATGNANDLTKIQIWDVDTEETILDMNANSQFYNPTISYFEIPPVPIEANTNYKISLSINGWLCLYSFDQPISYRDITITGRYFGDLNEYPANATPVGIPGLDIGFLADSSD